MIYFLLSFLFSSQAHSESLYCNSAFEKTCLEKTSGLSQKELLTFKASLRSQVIRKTLLKKLDGGCDSKSDPLLYEHYRYRMSDSLAYDESILQWMHDQGPSMILCYAKILENEVFTQIKSHLSKNQALNTIEEIRKNLLRSIEEELAQKPELQKLKNEMLENVKNIQIITMDRLEEWGKLNQIPLRRNRANLGAATNPDAGICAPDLLKRNAFFSSTGYYDETKTPIHTGMLSVVICPGQWLEVLKFSPAEAESTLWQLIGHEMGHSIDAYMSRLKLGHKDEQGNALNFHPYPAYESFVPCLQKEFHDILPEIENKNHPFYKLYRNHIFATLEHEPDQVEIRSLEMSADFWGNKVMGKMAKKATSLDELEKMLTSSMHRLCFEPETTKLYLNHEISTPSGEFRIEHSFLEPKTRETLGCQSLSTISGILKEKNFCSL